MKVDDCFIADLSLIDQSLVFTPRGNWPAGTGFTITIPGLSLQDYEYPGAFIRYRLSRDSALNWRALCGNSESSMTEIKDLVLDVQNEEALVTFPIPDAYKNGNSIVLRFENAKTASGEPFRLSEFRFFGRRIMNPDPGSLDGNPMPDAFEAAAIEPVSEEDPPAQIIQSTDMIAASCETSPDVAEEPQPNTMDESGTNVTGSQETEKTLPHQLDNTLDVPSEQEKKEELDLYLGTNNKMDPLLILFYGLPATIVLLIIVSLIMICFHLRKMKKKGG